LTPTICLETVYVHTILA